MRLKVDRIIFNLCFGLKTVLYKVLFEAILVVHSFLGIASKEYQDLDVKQFPFIQHLFSGILVLLFLWITFFRCCSVASNFCKMLLISLCV